MKTFRMLFIFIFISCIAQSQIIKGKVTEKGSGQPVVYANIGVLGKSIGCVTNEAGDFQLPMEGIAPKDILRCSMIGYKAQSFVAGNLDVNKELMVQLEEDTVQLSEVVVTGKTYTRVREVGGKSESRKMVTGWGGGSGTGGERGLKININRPPAILKDIQAHIAYNGFDSVLSRVHIYNIKENLPYQNLLNENIFIKSEASGWISKDLSPYNIVVKDDVIITLEWVKAWGKCKATHYCMLISIGLGGCTIWKEASENHWQKEAGFSPSIYVTVKD